MVGCSAWSDVDGGIAKRYADLSRCRGGCRDLEKGLGRFMNVAKWRRLAFAFDVCGDFGLRRHNDKFVGDLDLSLQQLRSGALS